MKRKDILSLSIAACLLAACSSSSDGGSNAVNPNQGTPSNPSTPSAPANPSTPAPTPTGTVKGTAYTADASRLNAIVHQLDGDEMNVIRVEDTTVDLTTPGNFAGKGYIVSTADYMRMYSGTKYQYVKFGYYDEKSTQDGSEAVFAHGNLTDVNDLPTGTATYVGEAYGINLLTNNYISGESIFTVDFDNKAVKGGIGAWQDQTTNAPDTSLASLDIEATINGNKFMQDSNDVKVDGAFYGPGAAELSGVAHNDEVGVGFGAIKQ